MHSKNPVSESRTDPLIMQIRNELACTADPAVRQVSRRFFKEEIACYGVKTAAVHALAQRYREEIRSREKDEVFALCEELYRSGMMEEAFIVSDWVPYLRGRFEPGDLAVFSRWIDTWITNWAACDSFCNHAVGDFIERFPEQVDDLKVWATSRNRWLRRASAVSLILPVRRGKFLDTALRIATLLIKDPDDMVQKGYGWLLKEASREHTPEVFAFVMGNRSTMPRTALRYAVELMPVELRKEAMKKER